MNKAKSLSMLLGAFGAVIALWAPAAMAAPPGVTIEPASALTATTAHFTGDVTTAGTDPTTCNFEYITDAAYQPRDEEQKIVIKATGGTFVILIEAPKSPFGVEETTPISFNASAEEVDSALEALGEIGPGGVVVSGGPGDQTGSAPYILVFPAHNAGAFFVEGSALTGAGAGAEGETLKEGHPEGFEGAQSADCVENPFEAVGSNPVSATASDLEPGTTYHLRLVAQNSGGSDEAAAPNFATEAVAPQIVVTGVTDVVATAATLHAQINPGGAPTSYHFEYLTEAQYDANGKTFAGATATAESPSLGKDNQAHGATATITGLQAATAYRFRVIAQNSMSAPGGTAGSAKSFQTAPSACSNAAVREQQRSTFLPECRAYEMVSTAGLDLGDANRIPFASDDGNAVAYLSAVAPDKARGAGLVSISLARRGPAGWTSVSADPKALGPVRYASGFTDFTAFSADLSRVLVGATLPLVSTDVNEFQDFYRVDVGPGSSTLLSTEEDFIVGPAEGASRDLERVFFHGATGGIDGVYVSDGTHRELVSRYPGEPGKPLRGDFARLASRMYSRGLGSSLEGTWPSPFVQRGGAHAVSDDGSRVYFTDGGGLYFRDLGVSSPHTIPVSASSRTGDGGDAHLARFLSASHDGSTAYIASQDQLSDAATPGGGIYRFDLATESLTQITPAGSAGGVDVNSALVSDDQSHIYFTSHAALAGAAQEDDANMYVWTSGEGVRFIGSNGGSFLRVTPDGRYMLFYSNTSIDGAPNNGFLALYRYDFANDEVTCVSCRPDGSPSQGDADIAAQSNGLPGSPGIINRALSFDGRVAFDSTDQIVADDRNSAMDVYLYHDGTTSLLTPGDGAANSFVGDISDDGRNVTLLTRSPLLGVDRDAEEYDAYDVRVEGGFLEPLPPPAPCEGESCRSQATSAPSAAAPSTPRFIGPGNPKPCAKGKTRRNGRCEKPRKHQSKKHKSKKHKRAANADGRAGQ